MSKNGMFAFTSEWLVKEKVIVVCGDPLMDATNLRRVIWKSADTILSVPFSKSSLKEDLKKLEGELCVRDWNGYRP